MGISSQVKRGDGERWVKAIRRNRSPAASEPSGCGFQARGWSYTSALGQPGSTRGGPGTFYTFFQTLSQTGDKVPAMFGSC